MSAPDYPPTLTLVAKAAGVVLLVFVAVTACAVWL